MQLTAHRSKVLGGTGNARPAASLYAGMRVETKRGGYQEEFAREFEPLNRFADRLFQLGGALLRLKLR